MKSEKKHERNLLRIEIIAITLGFIATCITSYVTVRHERKQSFRGAMITERLDIYRKVCKAAGRIVGDANNHSDSLVFSIDNFDKLYFGEMALIEDESVRLSAKDLRLNCIAFQKKKISVEELRNSAAEFTTTCRESIIRSQDSLFDAK